MKKSLNLSAIPHSYIINDIRIAKEAGYDGVELQYMKLIRYLERGLSAQRIVDEMEGIEASAISHFPNIERVNMTDDEFDKDIDAMCKTGHMFGAKLVLLCTGPEDNQVISDFKNGIPLGNRYKGLLGHSDSEIIKMTARRVARAAKIAGGYGQEVFIEPMGVQPINTMAKTIAVIEETGCDNVGLVVDIWHVWTAGDYPETIAKIPLRYIKNVHICDGKQFDRSRIPNEPEQRDIWTGAGVIPIQEYIDAIKSTGYDGWYTMENFCKKTYEEDYLKVATALKQFLDIIMI